MVGRERTQREDELQRQVEDDSAQGPVVRAKAGPSAPSIDEGGGQLAAGHDEYRGWCPFCVAGKGKNEAHRRMEASRDHEHPELHLDSSYMGREAEDGASPILAGKFSKDRWLVSQPEPCKSTEHRCIVGKLVNDVTMSGVQTLVIKFDQEASVMDVKNSLMRKLRSTEGFKVMPEESQACASAANVLVERSVWEMWSTARSLTANAEWFMKRRLNLDV